VIGTGRPVGWGGRIGSAHVSYKIHQTSHIRHERLGLARLRGDGRQPRRAAGTHRREDPRAATAPPNAGVGACRRCERQPVALAPDHGGQHGAVLRRARPPRVRAERGPGRAGPALPQAAGRVSCAGLRCCPHPWEAILQASGGYGRRPWMRAGRAPWRALASSTLVVSGEIHRSSTFALEYMSFGDLSRSTHRQSGGLGGSARLSSLPASKLPASTQPVGVRCHQVRSSQATEKW